MDDEDYQDNTEYSTDSNGWGGCLGFIVTIVVIYFIFQLFSDSGKYEGLTAEEWFNEYDQVEADYEDLKSCIEDNPHDAEYQCL